MISETIDDLFWIEQFLFDGFSATLRIDRDRNGGGNIPFIMTSSLNLQSLNLQVECFYVQLNPCEKIQLLSCSYNLEKSNTKKGSFQKLTPKFIYYRKYKRFWYQNFRDELLSKQSKEDFNINSLKRFTDIHKHVWNKYAS